MVNASKFLSTRFIRFIRYLEKMKQGMGGGRTVSAGFSVMLTFADGKLVGVFLLSDTEDQFRSENENSSSVPMPRQYNCLHVISENNWA